MKKIIFLSLLVLGVLAVWASSIPNVPPKVSALSKAKLIYLKPTKVLTVKMNKPKGSIYQEGENIFFTIENKVAGYLYILDIPPEGTVTQIYPNYYEKDNFLKAGKHVIPSLSTYKFTVSGKIGLEFVEFILSSEPLNFLASKSTTKSNPFAVLSGSGKKDYLKFKLKMMKAMMQKFQKWTAWTYFYIGNDKTKTLLEVKTEPSACEFYLDGKYEGLTPLTLPVVPGYHEIKVKKRGYKSWSGIVYVEFNETKELSVKLISNGENMMGTLDISVNPRNSIVYVDGKEIGRGSQSLKLAVGYHSVKVTMSGYQPYYNGAVEVLANRRTKLYVVLQALTANLYIRSQPYVNVYIDGVYAGGTGYNGVLYLQGVKVGYHIMKFVKEWYITQQMNYDVLPGDNFISVMLTGAGMLKVDSNVYPIEVSVDGKYLGDVKNVSQSLFVPIGTHLLTFSNPEYISVSKTVDFSFQKTVVLPLNMKLKPLTMNVFISPNPFSPNGDWYEDTTTFYVTLSRHGTLKVKIYSSDGELVWSRDVKASYGINRITWDGISNEGAPLPNGVYKVLFTVNSYGKTLTKTLNVVINKNVYTYLKQIVLIGGILLVLGLLYFVFK